MQESAGPGQNPALAAARIWFVSWGWSFPGEAPPSVASAPVWRLWESLAFLLTSLPRRLSLLSSP